ncbi:MAG: group II intron maturase-specific domain-containing protein [Chloroflexota bacterium]
MRRKVKKLTRRNQGDSWLEICGRLRRAVVGWVNYYALADARSHMAHLDGYMRRRIRQLIWVQWKTSKNRYRNLRRRGVSEYWSVRLAGTSKGPWRTSLSPPIHDAVSNAYLERVKLVSFRKRYDKLRRT